MKLLIGSIFFILTFVNLNAQVNCLPDSLYRDSTVGVYPRPVTPANPKGAALCVFKDPQFESVDIQLEKGDRIFLYTDGLFEVMNEQEEVFGEARLIKMLEENISLSAQEFGDLLLNSVFVWAKDKDHLEDDIALIVIDVTI